MACISKIFSSLLGLEAHFLHKKYNTKFFVSSVTEVHVGV